MELREFHNGLRVLRSIDKHEIVNISDDQWAEFRNGPYAFLIKCDDPTAEAIWNAMQKRMTR